MEDLKTLRMKKKLLLIELKALEEKISLYEDESITATEVLESESLKTQTKALSNTTLQETAKTKPIPEQTAPGKESTNPLKAEVLLKNLIKETTTPIPQGKTSSLVHSETNAIANEISKMTILSSTNKSKKDLNLRPDYKQALGKPAERYYVIYKGPHAGIHTDWGTVETFLKVDKVTCKKFSNEAQARMSLALTKEVENSTKRSTLLKPKIHKIKETNRDQRFLVPQEIEDEVSRTHLTFEDFKMLWNKIRAAGPEDLIHEKFFSSDKKTKSLYNFVEGADPALIHKAFSAGLVDNIYPSANLLELRNFPRRMVEAIKNFRRNVLKAKDDPIYIKIISSLPDWQQGMYYDSYHHMEIGLASNKKEFSISEPQEDINPPNEDVLQKLRITGLRRIAEKIIDIISGTKKKVNYADSHCIITSWSKASNKEDFELISKYGVQFKNNTLDVTANTHQVFCRQADALFEEHACNFCKVDSPTTESPSTEEKEESLSSETSSV